MLPILKASLALQEICPSCGASWKALQKDLETEPLGGSYELDLALIIIMRCSVCESRFEQQLDTIKRVYQARRLDKVGIEYGK